MTCHLVDTSGTTHAPDTPPSALQYQDAGYEVSDGVIELDAGTFGQRRIGNQCAVLVAIETKAWGDAQGRECNRAGFAKVVVMMQGYVSPYHQHN